MKKGFFVIKGLLMLSGLVLTIPAFANLPGGGTGTGPDVSVTDNGDGTVTMANGVVSIHIVKNGASINQMNYTYNNGSGTQTQQLFAGGKDGGEFYWETGGWGGNPWVYSLVANNGSYAEVDLYSDSATNGLMDVHFSMLRGSPGFYVTPIWSHRPQDAAMGTGEERDNIYIAPYFNWMSVNGQVQRETGINATYTPAFYSPQEDSLVTSGVLQGTYDDKYKWSADFGVERVWGWSSVSDPAIGLVGQNLGIWHVVASSEFYNGGPLKPELNDAPMVNMINGGHYYFGNDSNFGSGESWTRVSGPYFIYVNNVTNTLTDPVQTSQALYADAQAQAAAEATAWPYSWFNNANYASAAQRGTVTGKIVINDIYNPNASASNLWVGVEQQPVTTDNVFDFQLWMKPYEFWVKTDANGNFTIPNVIAGNNYTLYAFGPGVAGTFMSQSQNGGNPNLLYNLASPTFAVVVTGGVTNNLGNVTWTPARVGPTVFEIGYPDRKGDKFRHGDDYWVGDIGPSTTAPSPIWTKFLEFPFDFPNGLNYTVGQNRWNTDWNFIQSVYPDMSGNSVTSSSSVTFNLPSAPGSGNTASLYLGIASDDNSPLYVTVNGTLLINGNATGSPQTALPNTGWFPENDISDSNIREENHGGFSDERLTFSGSLLQAGNNTINLSFRQAGGSGFTHHFIYDYVRLELTGYAPPASSSVTAYPGNSSVLLSWPATPGATSYYILRSTTSGSGYISVTNGVTGPVCGSGPQNATFVDTTAANGTTYYYVVQSVNPVGASTNSPQSSGVTPSAEISTSVPAAPSVVVTSTNNSVTLNWSAVPGANFYTIQRGTVLNKIGYVAFYSTLDNATTGTSFTDSFGTLGCTYSYLVTATGAAGTSSNSLAVTAKPVPPPPASAPANVKITTTVTSTNQSAFIRWSPVSGAVGYILYRANNPNGPFSFPGNYIQSMMTTNYTDGGLNSNTLYSYTVVAMNAGGVSGNSAVVSTPPAAPASLNAYPGNTQITLTWSAPAGATNYVLKRGNSSGNETTTVVTTTNTTYLDTNLVNGTTYYYIVIANGTGGASLNSPEASATPFAGPPAIYWINIITTAAQGWNVNSNWSNGTAFPNAVQAAAIINSSIAANQTVNLNQAITLGSLSAGSSGGAFNITANGGALTFDNSPGQTSLVQLSSSKGDTISAPMTVNGSLIVSNFSVNVLNLLGTLGGGDIFINGNVALNGTNSYSGGTTINSGTVQLNAGQQNVNNAGVGTGPITFQGGTLQLNGYAGNNGVYWGALSNNLVVASGQTGTLQCAARVANNGLLGTLTGGGTLNVTVDYVRGSFAGDWSAFAGQINVSPRSGTGDFRINNALGYANAAIYLNAGANLYNINAAGQTTDIGELGGASGSTIGSGSGASTNPTFRIGAKNTTNTFAGTISDAGATSLIKTGTGTFILTGTNTYSGGTTVSGGILAVNNSAGSATGSGAVTIANGGTLGGTGIIFGAVTVQSGGTLAPGNPLGVLAMSNNLTLAAGSTTFVQIGHSPLTNNAVKVFGTLVEGGTLSVTNLGVTAFMAGDSFKLFNVPNYSGSFAGFELPPLTGNLTWNTNTLKYSGVLSVVTLTPPVIAGIKIAGGNLVFSGSGGAGDWPFLLLTSTNLTASPWIPMSTNQFDASGNFILTNTINPNSPQTFYRLQLQ
jgi:rhamnogalacturonan endolyase